MTNSKATKKALFMSMLSLLLCFTMLMGATFAWFTDTVTSKNNIIKSGNLDVEMYWADGSAAVPTVDTDWKDASQGAIFDYSLWEPGYTEARHLRIANVGDLAFNYGLRFVANGTVSKLADVIDVYYFENAQQLTRENVEDGTYLGTITDILGTDKNISDTVAGQLTANTEKQITLALKMKESAGNEYQNLSIGTDFSVELIATQSTYEKDSFDDQYDKNALSTEVPAALVRELENKTINATLGIGGKADSYTLDTAYQFEPTQSYDELLKSEYKYYLADFVVSADRDVPAGSIALGGYYQAWCQFNDNNWVAMVNEGLDVKAGQEIYLVEALGAAVHYKDICQYGNDGIGFLCGAKDLTGVNAGTTLTVKLCLFETIADPNGSSASTEKVEGAEPIVIGEFKYTFDGKTPITYDSGTMGGLYEYLPTLEDGDTLILPAGTYTVGGTLTIPAGVTIVGDGGTDVIFHQSSADQDDIFNCAGDAIIRNITFESNYKGYAVTDNTKNHDTDGNITIENCKFKGIGSEKNWGVYKNLNGNLTIKNCTFDNYNNAICGVNNGNGSTTIITGCTFTNINGEAIGYVTSSMPADFETDVIANNTGLTADNVIGY